MYIDQEQHDALISSIEDRWAFLAKGEVPKEHSCPLCAINNSCTDCVIYDDTGKDQCSETVYYDWYNSCDSDFGKRSKSRYTDPKTIDLATKMLEYLKDLEHRCVII